MKRILLAAAAVIATAGGALAADISPIVVVPPPMMPVVVPANDPGSLYISAFGGIAMTRNVVWYQPEDNAVATLQLRGFRLAGTIGANIGGGPLSVEGDVTWTRATPTAYCTPPDAQQPGCEPVDGDDRYETEATLLTLMGNVRIGPNHGFFRPYVAFGGGAARLSVVTGFGADGLGPDGGDNADWTWGVQAIVGVDLAINDTFSIGARYRFQHIGPTHFLDLGDDAVTVGAFNVHSIEGGITIHFGG